MHEVVVTQTIPQPTARVWETLSDFGNVYRFHPFVRHSETLNEMAEGQGAERVCRFYDGNEVKERIIDYNEGRSMKIDVYEGSMPLKSMNAEMEVIQRGEHTQVRMRFLFEAKYGPLGWIMGALMMRRMFAKMGHQVIQGLGNYLKSGRLVEKGGKMGELALA